MPHEPILSPPRRTPLALRPIFAALARALGHVPLPARLLAHAPKSALAAGVLEAFAPGARDMHAGDGARLLAIVRIVASRAAQCPFCIDMNVAVGPRVGLSDEEQQALFSLDDARFEILGARGAVVARYALAASRPPVELAPELVSALRRELDDHDVVVVAATLASVHFWARFSEALGVPSEGFAARAGVAEPGA